MRFLTLLVIVLFSTATYAQMPGGGNRPGGGGQQMNMGRLYGKIIDSKTGKPIDAATVTLTQNKFDSVSKTRKDVIVNGQLTKANGEFSLEGLNIMAQYKLKITAIGYKTVEQRAGFTLSNNGGDMSQMLNNIDKDLGNIKLEEEIKQLGEVVVTGEKPTLQLGIDRKIFNVDKNIVSQGGTAVDVMRNVPTVTVDVDGNVTMRNNAPQLFVDGRPTVLTLDQIPADAIQSIELITNPSAKFDASGGQSSIINVVLKKNKRVGYSGGIRAGVDMRGRVNGGMDLNLRQGKVNFFANVGMNQRKSISFGETDRQEKQFGSIPANNMYTRNRNVSLGGFMFGRAGFDFFINNRNTISVTGNFGGGNFDFNDLNNIRYDTLALSKTENEYRLTDGENLFRNVGGQLSYKHNFAKAGKELTADINFNKSRSENDQEVNFTRFDQSGSFLRKGPVQSIDGGGRNQFFVAQMDYVNPINENMKWEAGARSQVRWFYSFQKNSFNGVYQPLLSNEFEYIDYVHAAYATFSQKIKKANFNYQLGLRAESSEYDGEQIGKSGRFQNQFPLALFPSVFMSKSITDNQDLQLNYTRRINRPNFFQLLPNTDYSDPFNYQTGNPNLRPEFTNSLELSYQLTYGEKRNTFLFTLFGKQTNNLIARYQSRKELGQTGDSAFVTTYINASESYAAGLELVFRNTVTKFWEINYNANFYYSKINGSAEVPDLENERNSFFIKLNNTFRLGKGWTAQLSGDYNSRSILPVSSGRGGGGGGRMGGFGGFGGGQLSTTQGYIDANYYMDLGIRKEFKVKKTNTATISLNWSDVLSTRKNIVYATSAFLDQTSWRRRDPTFVRLNFSYRFGKFDASLFKRKNTRVEMDDANGVQ
jgi:outer membrane receptor protein involved in Fe transport